MLEKKHIQHTMALIIVNVLPASSLSLAITHVELKPTMLPVLCGSFTRLILAALFFF